MASNNNETTGKQIVQMLMEKVGKEIRTATSKNNSVSGSARVYLIYSCPRGEKCIGGGKLKFLKASGFTNPYNHLKSCIADGDKQLCWKFIKQKGTEKTWIEVDIISKSC